MQMNGLAEMITAAKYRDLWEDPRLIVAVWNNRDLDQVTWEQMEATAASILKGDADRGSMVQAGVQGEGVGVSAGAGEGVTAAAAVIPCAAG